jgi:pimeloyl-ACP methyl ester carboxylesterase/DNA-binding CsgD family transcriptional regulator
MEAPPVQYVTTTDGTSIAYAEFGEGEPMVFLPIFIGSLHQWLRAGSRSSRVMLALAARYHLIFYDPRGQGLSTQDLSPDVSLDDFIADFEAVRERLGLQRFIMLGSCNFALLAGHYAARYPERVKALILVNGAVSWEAWRLSSVYDKLPQEDWELFLYNMAPADYTPEETQRVVDALKSSMTQRDYLVSAQAWHKAALDAVLPSLQAPTLVLHSKNFRLRSVEGPLELARRLPNARVSLMDSNWLFGHPGQAITAIDQFVAELNAAPAGEPDLPRQGELTPVLALSPRQRQVLGLIAAGKTNGEIADELVISLRTVERHVAELYAKIGARNRVEAAAYAMSHLVKA